MAQQDQGDYKKKLRQRSVSTPASMSVKGSNKEVASINMDLIAEGQAVQIEADLVEEQNQSQNTEKGQENQRSPPTKSHQIKEVPVVDMDEFQGIDMENKLNVLMLAINKMNSNFHYKFESLERKLLDKGGILSQITDLEDQYEELSARMDDAEGSLAVMTGNSDRIDALEKSVLKLTDDMATLKGFAQVQDTALRECKTKITDLTMRSMAKNIVIHGITGDNTEEKVLSFFREKMSMEVKDEEVEVAHRIGGPPRNEKPRMMVVRCETSLRERIFNFTKNLKGKTNNLGDSYSVKSQLPEPLSSERNEREEKMRHIRKANSLIPEEEKHRRVMVNIKNNTLYVNKVAQKQHFKPPTVFNLKCDELNKLEEIDIISTEVVEDKGSVFQGHAVKIKNSGDVRTAYKKLKLNYPESNHIIMAYSMKSYFGHCDDGEYTAGKRLQRIVSENARAAGSTAVFVTREFGGIHLGPRRFLHIDRVAKDAIMQLYPV